LNEDSARRFLLVRAVESEDASETLLTRDDRHYATGAALAQATAGETVRRGDGMTASDEAFLARRSDFAFPRLSARFPAVGRVCRSARWPAWIGWALPLAALALGAASNEIDSGQRLNIIAFPLIGMLAWNLAVYLWLFVGVLRRPATNAGGGREPNLLARLLERVAQPARRHLDAQPALGRALARFASDWLHFSSKLTYSRASRTLHLSAAALAAGVLLGMYLRALGIEYRAGWESTFIDADALQRLIALVLGPASVLTDIPLPSSDRLQALRWSGPGSGENAGPWIHLYAATALLFIIGPRLLLAAWHAARAARLRRRFPVPGSADFYVRRLLRSARGQGAVVRVIPYSFHLPERSERQLQRLLTDALGDKTRMIVDAPIPYGSEDEWLAAADLDHHDFDYLAILFNLSATPEAENHGALVAGIRRLMKGRSGSALTVLLDESAYRQRLAGQGGADARLETRRQAWTAILAPHDVQPVAIDVDDGDSAALVRRIEAAMLKAPAHAGGAA
jgi:hypothetical protein